MTEHLTENQWISTAERLPEMEQPVIFLLSGAPTEPRAGFRDCPRSYCERHPNADHFGWSLQTWWTEFRDDGEAWEDRHVTHWHPISELPT